MALIDVPGGPKVGVLLFLVLPISVLFFSVTDNKQRQKKIENNPIDYKSATVFEVGSNHKFPEVFKSNTIIYDITKVSQQEFPRVWTITFRINGLEVKREFATNSGRIIYDVPENEKAWVLLMPHKWGLNLLTNDYDLIEVHTYKST